MSGNISSTTFDSSTFNISTLNSSTYNSSPMDFHVNVFLAEYCPFAYNVHRNLALLWYVIGFVGNTISAIAWFNRRLRRRNSSAIYLAALSVNDLIYLFLHVFQEINYIWNVRVLAGPHACESFFFFFLVPQYLCPLLVFAFTVERFIAICHPLHRQSLCRARVAFRTTLALLTVSVLMSLLQPLFLEYDAQVQDCLMRSGIDGLEFFWLVWTLVTESVVFLCVPLATFALDVVVVRRLNRLGRDPLFASDRSLGSEIAVISRGGESREGGTKTVGLQANTKMLLTVSIFEVLTTIPLTILYLLGRNYRRGDLTLSHEEILADPKWQAYISFISTRVIIQEICLAKNASLIFIYLAMGTRFRQVVFDLLFCRRKPPSFKDRTRTTYLASSTSSRRTHVHQVIEVHELQLQQQNQMACKC